jgi:gliding motility-associated-like protein
LNRSFLIFLSVFSSFCGRAQVNLVPNPSLEIIDSCYGTSSGLGFDVFQWSACLGWRNPTFASSDLWCENGIVGNLSPPSISPGLYQYPRSGSNMAGCILFDPIDSNYREYVQTSIIPMAPGMNYSISFYVNVMSNDNVTSSMGAYISSSAIGNSSSFTALPFVPQISNPLNSFISDTLDWTLVSGIYRASGGEQYMTIGSFDPYPGFPLQQNDSFAGMIYAFVDDVSITQISLQYSFPNVFTPNDDDVNSTWAPTISGTSNVSIAIFNRWGTRVYDFQGVNDRWDGRNTSGEECVEGIYYYVFSTEYEGSIIKEKGFIQLLR